MYVFVFVYVYVSYIKLNLIRVLYLNNIDKEFYILVVERQVYIYLVCVRQVYELNIWLSV